jgi:hypothetical protein
VVKSWDVGGGTASSTEGIPNWIVESLDEIHSHHLGAAMRFSDGVLDSSQHWREIINESVGQFASNSASGESVIPELGADDA